MAVSQVREGRPCRAESRPRPACASVRLPFARPLRQRLLRRRKAREPMEERQNRNEAGGARAQVRARLLVLSAAPCAWLLEGYGRQNPLWRQMARCRRNSPCDDARATAEGRTEDVLPLRTRKREGDRHLDERRLGPGSKARRTDSERVPSFRRFVHVSVPRAVEFLRRRRP